MTPRKRRGSRVAQRAALFRQPRNDNAPTVLCVSGDEVTRAFVVHALERAGFGVIETCDRDDALTVIEEHAAELALLIVDLTGICGAMDVHLPHTLFLLGSRDDRRLEHAEVLYLPFGPDELVARVRRIIHCPKDDERSAS